MCAVRSLTLGLRSTGTLRGKHAQKEWHKLLHVGSELAIALPLECQAQCLRVVNDYKHLGSAMDRFGRASPDVPGRTASALSAYAPLALKVFGAARI